MDKFFIFMCAVYIACGLGWIMNIVAIAHSGPIAQWGGLMIARCIGVVFAPLGIVLGYF